MKSEEVKLETNHATLEDCLRLSLIAIDRLRGYVFRGCFADPRAPRSCEDAHLTRSRCQPFDAFCKGILIIRK